MTFPAQTAPGKQRLRGRILFRLSIVFGVLGVGLIVLGVLLLANGVSVGSFARVPLDGQGHRVQLTRTGAYVAYYEGPGIAADGSTPTFRLRVVGPSGADVTVSPYSRTTSLTYDTGGHHGSAAGKFSITKAGTYTVGGEVDNGATSADVALGKSIAGSLVGGVVSLIGGILLVAAVVLLIVGIFRRRGHRRQLVAGYAYPAASGYPGYPPAGPPPGYPLPGYPPAGPPPDYPPAGPPPGTR